MASRKVSAFRTLTRRTLDRMLSKITAGLEADLLVDIGGKFSRYSSFVKHTKYLNVDLDPDVRPSMIGDLHALPLRSETTDIVLATEILEHCHSPEIAVSELHRILRPGGICILSTRFIFPIHKDPEDYYRFTESGLRFLFRRFPEVDVLPHGNLVMAVWDLLSYWLPHLIAFNALIERLKWRSSVAPLGFVVKARK